MTDEATVSAAKGRAADEAGAGATPDAGGAGRATVSVGRALGTVVVTVRGRLEGADARHLATVLLDLILNQGNLTVAVDARGLREIDPSGVDVFAHAWAWSGLTGASFTVNGAVPAVADRLQAAGLADALVASPTGI